MKKVCTISGLITVIVFFCIHFSAAQGTFKMHGTVSDTITKEPLDFVTITLFQAGTKSKPFKVINSDKNGAFLLVDLSPGAYILYTSYIGYNRSSRNIEVTDRDLDLKPLLLGPAKTELKGVTVKSSRPLIEIGDDRVSYLVQNDPMANGEKAIDLLRKTPMISIDGNDNVAVNGQTNFIVLVNGKETAMFTRNLKEALKAYPGSAIKKIEVITNPSSKYDAEGVGGIINIITNSKVIGYNATISAEANSVTYRGTNASLNFKYGKVGFDGSFGTGGNNNLSQKNTQEIDALVPSTFFSRYSVGNNTQTNKSPFGNAELSYELDSLNALSLYGSLSGNHTNDIENDNYDLVLPNKTDHIFSTYGLSETQQSTGWTTGLDYIKKFKNNPEKELTVKLFGDFGNDDTHNESQQFSLGNDRFILNDNKAPDRQLTMETDYIQPFKNKSKLEMGIKAIIRHAESDYQSFDKTNPANGYVLNNANSDNFNYHQNVYSAYGSYNFKISAFSIRTGVRIEHTKVDGDFKTSNTKVMQDYTNVIPNLLASTKLKNGASVSFSYTMRLSRPYISYLNPFINNADSLNVYTGNPAIKPQFFHVTNVQYRITSGKTFLSASLGNSYSNSRIVYTYSFNKSTGVTTISPQNIGTSSQSFLNLSANANPASTWQINFNARVSYDYLKSDEGLNQMNSGFTGNIGYNTSYSLTSKITASTFFNYYLPTVALQGSFNAYYAYGIGGKFKLLKGLSANAYFNNFFAKDGLFDRVGIHQDDNFRTITNTYLPFRSVGLSLTWNFGKLTDNVSKKRGVQNDDLMK